MRRLIYAFQNTPDDSSDYKGTVILWLMCLSFAVFFSTMLLAIIFDMQLQAPWYERAYNMAVYISGALCSIMAGIHIGYNLRANEEAQG